MFVSLELLVKKRRELDAQVAAWLRDLAEYDRSGDWSVDQFQSAASAIRHACRMTHGVAHTNVDLARKLEKLPEVAAAFAAGEISARHTAVIAHAFTAGRAAALSEVEGALVETARNAAPDELGRAVRYVTDAIDGDGGAAADDELYARPRYHGSRSIDNMLNVDALYDPEAAEIHELERDYRANDDRSLSQRRADAVTNLFRQSLDHGRIGTSRAVRPHITQVVHLDRHPGVTADLLAVARVERQHLGHLSSATVERIMCDCDVSRVVMVGASEILDVGRATRTVTAAQWKALVVRDRHCRAVDASNPPNVARPTTSPTGNTADRRISKICSSCVGITTVNATNTTPNPERATDEPSAEIY